MKSVTAENVRRGAMCMIWPEVLLSKYLLLGAHEDCEN